MTEFDPVVAEDADDVQLYEPPPLPEVSPEQVFRRCDDVIWVQISDEVVAYQPADAVSHVLSAVAGLVWQCLDGESRLGEILADVADAFEVQVEQVVDDFVPVVGEWLLAEIVEEVAGASDLASNR